MGKKQIKNKNKNEAQMEIKNRQTIKIKAKTKKFSIKVTSKMKKKLKYTQKKLNIDKTKLNKIIFHLIKEEGPKDNNNTKENLVIGMNNSKEEIEQQSGVPIYLYITLKKDLKDEEIKIFKNKLLKIKYPMINDIIFICLIEDKLTNEEKEKLIEITNSKIDIITKEELKNNIKNLQNIDLDNQYQIFVSNINNSNYLNKKWDIIYYQQSKFDIIKDLIETIYKGGTVVKIINKKNNILKIKFGYTNMTKEELADNAYRLVYKTIPLVLANAEKYNGIENIIIKTNNSIPFTVFGNINPGDINHYNHNKY